MKKTEDSFGGSKNILAKNKSTTTNSTSAVSRKNSLNNSTQITVATQTFDDNQAPSISRINITKINMKKCQEKRKWILIFPCISLYFLQLQTNLPFHFSRAYFALTLFRMGERGEQQSPLYQFFPCNFYKRKNFPQKLSDF